MALLMALLLLSTCLPMFEPSSQQTDSNSSA